MTTQGGNIYLQLYTALYFILFYLNSLVEMEKCNQTDQMVTDLTTGQFSF